MSDIKYDAEKLASEAQSHIDKFRHKMKEIAEECLGEIYVNITPYIETDSWTNYREALRIELQHEYKYSNFKQDWAVDFRRAVFVENREEISKLIESDILKRIKHLEDCNQEFDQFRYSPGGDRYQDLVTKHERVIEAHDFQVKLNKELQNLLKQVQPEVEKLNSQLEIAKTKLREIRWSWENDAGRQCDNLAYEGLSEIESLK